MVHSQSTHPARGENGQSFVFNMRKADPHYEENKVDGWHQRLILSDSTSRPADIVDLIIQSRAPEELAAHPHEIRFGLTQSNLGRWKGIVVSLVGSTLVIASVEAGNSASVSWVYQDPAHMHLQ